MKDLIERIARALVDNPEEVAVTALEGSQSTVLELKVAKDVYPIYKFHRPVLIDKLTVFSKPNDSVSGISTFQLGLAHEFRLFL